MTKFEGSFAVVVSLLVGAGIHQAYANQNKQRDFSRWLYERSDWMGKICWLGVPTQKKPMNMWVYQDILYETKPDVLVEAGTADGGAPTTSPRS